ncbi:14 kDa proline-rich protein DC2.15-like [Ipomoea triloba]|uniref:14 kDa proline-rich protein DC2.15-like n=1 Tax=Ipomoea triloba TaxID=35885 RepID=UPI00125E5CA6|nr:14 kDa proline-rich protein DC2.15-like [Ipomoea triloba]
MGNNTNYFFSTTFILSLLLLLLATFTTACSEPCRQPKPKPSPSSSKPPFCPRDTLKFGACVEILGLGSVGVGGPTTGPCCAVLQGLADLEVAACLCTALKANVLGIINLNMSVALSVLFSACHKTIPDGFKCE